MKMYTLRNGFKVYRDEAGWHTESPNGEKVADAKSYEEAYNIATTKGKTNADERKYWVKEGWIFNLESMHDRVYCIGIDIEEGKLDFPLTIANTPINDWGDLYNLIEEAGALADKAKSGKVSGKDYGRMREMVCWRVEQRYIRCIQSGMSEADAGMCFTDM